MSFSIHRFLLICLLSENYSFSAFFQATLSILSGDPLVNPAFITQELFSILWLAGATSGSAPGARRLRRSSVTITAARTRRPATTERPGGAKRTYRKLAKPKKLRWWETQDLPWRGFVDWLVTKGCRNLFGCISSMDR